MKKIMFNDRYGLTKAVLEGRKTMTRRIVPECRELDILRYWEHNQGAIATGYEEHTHSFRFDYCPDKKGRASIDHLNLIPFYKVGEEVAVAQRYKDIIGDRVFFVSSETGVSVHRSVMEREKGWTNKMNVAAEFMPHHIRITDIKVERLKEISDEDCMKEGIAKWNRGLDLYYYCEEKYSDFNTPREAFAALIDKVNGKGTWESNPWVFAYTFELVKGGQP